MFPVVCSACREEVGENNSSVLSLRKEYSSGTVTHACCTPCFIKHQKAGAESGWKVAEDDNGMGMCD